MKVAYTKVVQVYLWELIETLYCKNYFGFKAFAREYVLELINDMEATIHIKQKHKATGSFSRYGKDLWYVSYTKNKRTTWYFFFSYHPADDVYFIRYITNNHVAGHLLE